MKLKLYKSEHLQYFNMLKQIDKTSLSIKENKSVNNDSLVFYSKNDKLNIFIDNGISASNINLNIDVESDVCFAVDANLFYNAFSNFPTDEVNFAFIQDNNSLVFGNKKTKVILNATLIENCSTINSEISVDNDNFTEINAHNLFESIKLTSFSCAPNFEEMPYSSIMFCVNKDKFNTQSSDKHRVSIYGNFDNCKSYIISKSSADLINSFIKPNHKYTYLIENNKLFLKWDNGILSIKLEINIYENVFNSLQKFLECDKILEVKINKQAFLKSLKFVSSISSSDTIDLNFKNNELIISGSNSNKGLVADKFPLLEEVEELAVSYVTNHFVKVLDTIEDEYVKFKISNYNDYNILIISASNYKHILFPMD